ncbi:HAD family hydrolase [Falsiroseomonas selenitidurans]|uniref:HAD-IA family hydrolase n=1 Tax=Falsiroseomonas selenitidurans TaxID=2716335 RepID=A0ABX1E6G0_9PROT|nr:HAD-IA family hydrolase [Falsiroseomonas selenitidurans]NKC32769.1 HAD-IA family hydrolase [Falsiroseomonas selenitidurans]
MSIAAVIFDCDGTLVDSETIGALAFAEALAEEGLAMTAAEVLHGFRGRRLATSMAEAASLLGRALAADFEARLRHRTAAALRAGLREMQGATALVQALRLPFCVASNAPRAKTELNLTLTGLLPHFEGRIFSAYEVGAWKPDPGLFLHAAEALGVRPAQCLVVEDSAPGVQAALAAGMPVVALLPEGPAPWLPAAVPHVRDLSAVASHLA